MPCPSRAGGDRISLWTFDASAEFETWQIDSAPADWVWTAPGQAPGQAWLPLALQPDTLNAMRQFETSRLNQSEATLRFAQRTSDLLESTIAADNVNYLAADQRIREAEFPAAVFRVWAAKRDVELAQLSTEIAAKEVEIAQARFAAVTGGDAVQSAAIGKLEQALAAGRAGFFGTRTAAAAVR